MQASSFMPAVQFSLLNWNYDQQTVEIVKEVLAYREEYGDKILLAAEQAVQDDSPVNRPMWWVDPTDVKTLTIDDQYMMEDDILVAPVLKEGAVSRDIYLPKGRWTIKVNGDLVTYEGPTLLSDFASPLETLSFLVREP